MEAEAKDGINNDFISLSERGPLSDLLRWKEGNVERLQLFHKTMVQWLVCPLGIRHLHRQGSRLRSYFATGTISNIGIRYLLSTCSCAGVLQENVLKSLDAEKADRGQ